MFADLLRQHLGFSLSTNQMEELERHFELLSRWNKVLNLTGLRQPVEIVQRHYCESLFLGRHLPPGALRVGDVGSGAGFPGIPIAILRPECSVALIESNQRKAVFLREATRQVPNIRVLAMRVESVRERFDWTTSRALKFVDIEKAAASMSDRVAVLGGSVSPSDRCFTWNTPVKLPWGSERYLWQGTLRST